MFYCKSFNVFARKIQLNFPPLIGEMSAAADIEVSGRRGEAPETKPLRRTVCASSPTRGANGLYKAS